MADPKTVREWLIHGWVNQLPEPLKNRCEKDLRGKLFGDFFDNIEDALECIAKELDNDFYFGIRRYIKFGTMPSQSPNSLVHVGTVSQNYKDGFAAAKAAFEAQQLPEPESPTFTGKIVSPVGYIAVAPDDHAELVRKADLYNDLKAVIDRLSCELEEMKKRFV